MELDELFYTALQADEDVVAAVGDRIISTGFEVAPDEKDNTPLPCIIVSYDGFENNLTSKDSVWEGEEDSVQASIEVDAESRKEVGRIMNLVRKAIANYIHSLYDQGEEIPSLKGVAGSDIQWFWEKPCYFQTVSYVCDVPNNIYENGSN